MKYYKEGKQVSTFLDDHLPYSLLTGESVFMKNVGNQILPHLLVKLLAKLKGSY